VLHFERGPTGVSLSCNHSDLPADSRNLVYRAATIFLDSAGISDGVRIRLEKNIPLAAGLGGGSGNAAQTLLGLNELFDRPLSQDRLQTAASALGSDVPFFLHTGPALARGRGEKIESLDPFAALQGAFILLIHPGFGISTAWAYQALARFPSSLNGQPGRARRLIKLLRAPALQLELASKEFYNSLEAPALAKYPLLALFQEFLRDHGAKVTLMSGSGSATFALVPGREAAERLREGFLSKFGPNCWTTVVPL
jgi:4-diphosphocytidyl-2-C-methyl-D-erythritol kinase